MNFYRLLDKKFTLFMSYLDLNILFFKKSTKLNIFDYLLNSNIRHKKIKIQHLIQKLPKSYSEYRLNNVIQYSIRHQDNNMIKLLLNCGYSIGFKEIVQSKVMSIHVQNNIFDLLLSKKCLNPNIHFKTLTPIFYAIQHNNIRLIHTLSSHKADLNVSCLNNETPIFLSAVNNKYDCLKHLLELNADPNKMSPIFSLIHNYKQSTRQFNDGQLNGGQSNDDIKISILKLLLQYKTNVNCIRVCDGMTPIFDAVKYNYVKVVQILIDYGADINMISFSNGSNSLLIGVEASSNKSVNILLENRVDPNFCRLTDNYSGVFIASKNNNRKCVKLLAKFKADPNINTVDGISPLLISSENNHYKCIKELIYAKADLNYKLNHTTSIYMCAYNGHYKASKLLLNAKADIDHTLVKLLKNDDNITFNLENDYYQELDDLLVNNIKKHNKIIEESIDTRCPICLDTIYEHNLKITRCFHIFHKKCWNRYGQIKCPICRHEPIGPVPTTLEENDNEFLGEGVVITTGPILAI